MHIPNIKKILTGLYEGNSNASYNFRYTLLAIDVVTIIFLVVSTFFYGSKIILTLDIIFGSYLALDYILRMWIAPKKGSFVTNWVNIADLIAIVAFLIPLLTGQFAFLRVLRIFRLLRSYRLIARLRKDFLYFRHHEDVIIRATNLFIFVFIMTELVVLTQVGVNPNVTNFLDALYFSISALTTTGFGDITLQGKYGYILSIIIMVFGVSLFLRLIHTIFIPPKLHAACNKCNLLTHERGAKHCRKCGTALEIK
ncbi:MAG: voltage-gated potassium channel [Rickettsiales bacterium]|jgi:voltage-gated potassium channel